MALAVVQSYSSRRKVPRSKISLSDLECCLSKASFSAAQNSGKFSTHLAQFSVELDVSCVQSCLDGSLKL